MLLNPRVSATFSSLSNECESPLFIISIADGFLAYNYYFSSHFCFIVILKNKSTNVEIALYGSWKHKRITGSILAFAVYAFSHGLDFMLALAHDCYEV